MMEFKIVLDHDVYFVVSETFWPDVQFVLEGLFDLTE